jgi:hypothetical protein
VTKWEEAAVIAGTPMPVEPAFQVVKEEEVPRDVVQRLQGWVEGNRRRGPQSTAPTMNPAAPNEQ